MKIAIVGSRSITVNNLGDYLPENTTEIVSGGATVSYTHLTLPTTSRV